MDHADPVEVDGVSIVGAYAAVGHPHVLALEHAFVNQSVIFPEHNLPVFERWSLIIENLPLMRGKRLHHNLTAVYQDAEMMPAGHPLIVAYDLSILQYRFWEVLWQNGMLLPTAHGYQVCAAQAWQQRLLVRIEEQKPWRRNTRGKLKKPVTKPLHAMPGKWFN